MLCQACGTENRADRKFCKECGDSLDVVCPACGAANEPADKFCGSCGVAMAGDARVVETQPAPDEPARAEQRFISVVFADLAGYTSLSERHDSEDIRDLLTTYFDRARAIVERFGGVVDKFIGDALMGIWGATTVREDDAQRAVRAALELVDMVAALGEEVGIPDLGLKAGVNSGLTSVGPGGNEKGLIVGDLVNVASRLESLAAAGTVNVGSGTQAVTSQAIDYEFLGEQTVKGKSGTVPAWRALRVASMVGGRAEEIHQPPFVGREHELRLLKDALAGVETEQRARLVSIVGEAGIGKTRLAEEFRNHIDGYTQNIYWHWGRSPSYGDGVTFWALGEMVRRRAGILENEDPARSRTRLRTMLADFVPSEEDRQWIEPRLSGLLGLAEMPAGSRAELFAALRSFFQNIATQGTAVLVFEDLHWGDPGLLEFVSELVERSTRSPILVVTLARPDLLERRPDWGTRHRSSMAARLAPLVDSEMRRMLEQYIPGVGDGVVQRITERSAGFPLYAVEIVRMLTASGELRPEGAEYRYEGDPSTMALPETLQTVIGARLDRLDSGDRSLLQDGAILGQSFTLEAIAALHGQPADSIEAPLTRLVQLELLELEDDPRSPERGQYRFVQSLIHEIAYQRLNRADRRAKHLAVAANYTDREDPELAGVIAGHYMGAYEATADGAEKDEMVARAVDALTSAADRAIALHSHEQGIRLLEDAMALAPDEGRRTEQRLKAAYAASEHNAPERGLEHLAISREHLESVGDVAGIRRVATAIGYIYNGHFQSDRALAAIEAVYEGLDEIDGPVAIQLAAEAARSYALTMHGAKAVAAADRVLPATAAAGDVETALQVLITKGTALIALGRSIEAYVLLRGAAAEAETRGLLEVTGRALNNLASIVQYRSPQEAARISERLGGVLGRVQNFAWEVRHERDMAENDTEHGRYAEAADRLARFDDEDLTPFWRHTFALERARIELRQTGDRAAFDRAWKAISFHNEEEDPQLRANLDASKAGLLREIGDWEGAYTAGMRVDATISWQGIWYALNAVAWLADSDKLTAVSAALAALDVIPGLDRYAEAIRLGFDGATEEAATAFMEVLDTWSVRMLDVDLAQAQATFARIVGSENPAAAEAARDAYDWLTATGTRSLLAVWADALPVAASDEVAAG